MGKVKEEVENSNEILTPVSVESDEIKEIEPIIKLEENFISESNYIDEDIDFFNSFQERNNKMINSVNPINQTVQPLDNVIFTGNNVRTNSCNSCCGWLSHNNNSGIFTITKPGIYKVHFNANVAPTVAGPITLNITNSGENIAGGEMKTAGTTINVFENISAEVLIKVPCNSSVVITVKNNTPTNPITVSQPSLVITREC